MQLHLQLMVKNLVINNNKDTIRFKPDKKKMPSEAISDGIFYFGARFFLPVFPPLPPSLSTPPPTPAAKMSVFLPILMPNLNKEAIGRL